MPKLVLSEEEWNNIIADYTAGMSMIQIAKKYHHGISTLRRIFQEKGITLRSKEESINTDYYRQLQSDTHKHYSVCQTYFDTQNSDMAYILGFLMADGNISTKNNRVQIALSAIDIDILYQIYNRLGGSPVATYTYNGRPYCRWQCMSVYMKKQLAEYDIIPQKTGYAKIPKKLNPEYYPDFIRGYFDGDGSIYEDNAVGLDFVSHNPEILQDILDFFQSRGIKPVTIHIDKRGNTNYYIRYRTESALKIYSILYSNPDCLKLERKYEKFTDIIQKKKGSKRLHTFENGEKIC